MLLEYQLDWIKIVDFLLTLSDLGGEESTRSVFDPSPLLYGWW